ncbi:MAG: FAD-dependent oxidoreductase [Deltaproteobacteria bacterium]|nr:FAD-dependent oxidoreductase [Deltaproteobacteria bacterium]
MTTWDEEVDIIVIGSGGGAMTAALVAKDRGSKVLVLEKSSLFGGSTAISGGSIWIPNNHLMAKANLSDSTEEGLAYLRGITSGQVADELLQAYVESSPEVVAYLEENSPVHFEITPDYPDYYPHVEGNKQGGRTLESQIFNLRKLGKHGKELRVPGPHLLILGRWMIRSPQARTMVSASLKSRLAIIRSFASYLLNPKRSFARRDTRLTLGNALCGALRLALMERGVPLWLESPVTKLINEDDRVTGVEATRGNRQIRIRARQGVIVAAGGFDKNPDLRKTHHISADCAVWSSGSPENTGDAITMGLEIGASLGNMKEAWWMPTTMVPGNLLPWYAKGSWWTEQSLEQGKDFPWFLLPERSLPGSIIVDASGSRFTNEAAPYLDVGHAQLEHHRKNGKAIPAFQVADHRFHMRYPLGPIMFSVPTKKFVQSGFLKKADSIEELAEQCGIDPQGLRNEIERYNASARQGKDPDFHRGATAIDRYYGDSIVKPNPCIAPIEKPPFYAIKVVPGDLGTKGGLRTDIHAQVLREDGRPIPGLYATGNCSASVMGPTYPGAGGTIGPAMTFGYRAARHATSARASA